MALSNRKSSKKQTHSDGFLQQYGLNSSWTVSIVIHLLVALVFFLITDSNKHVAMGQKQAPTASIDEPIESLEIEPIINDLQIETPTLEQQAMPDLPDLQAPSLDAISMPTPTQSDPMIASSQGSLNFSVPVNTTYKSFSSQFANTNTNAKRICYVVDYSGSMVIAFEYVRKELQKTIQQLSPAHYFQMIFYTGGTPKTLPHDQMIRATQQNRVNTLNFLKTIQLASAGNQADAAQSVVAALKKAFNFKSPENQPPDLIYLITDGEFDHKIVQQATRQLQQTSTRKIPINVIACGNKDNQSNLKRFALQNKGICRFVTTMELDAAIAQ